MPYAPSPSASSAIPLAAATVGRQVCTRLVTSSSQVMTTPADSASTAL